MGHAALDIIVRANISRIRPKAQAEIGWFAHQPSLHAAIEKAALAVNSQGKRYSHQRRLTKLSLERALDALLKKAGAMEQARDVAELFALIDAALEPIQGLGELYVYDRTLRIGSRWSLFPEKVYLHAGTRQGVRALGMSASAATLGVSDLPRELRALEPHEVEDVLCIFKDELASSRRVPGPTHAARRSWCEQALLIV